MTRKRRKAGSPVGKIESDKEHGIMALYDSIMPEYSGLLKKHFPEDRQSILAMSYCRLVKLSSMKMMDCHFSGSYMSENLPGAKLSQDSLTKLIRKVGTARLLSAYDLPEARGW